MIRHRSDIDGMRAVAVLAVVLFHAFPNVMPGGFIGVDVFFVISGYLISSIIIGQQAAGAFSFSDFYGRRIRRIFPALEVALVLVFALGWRMFSPLELEAASKQIGMGTVFLSNFLFYSKTGYFDSAAIEKPLLHLWSLSIEEQFYLLWPLLLVGWMRMRWNPMYLVLGGTIGSFAHQVLLLKADSSAAFYLPSARFWELMAGALVACIHLSADMQTAAAQGRSLAWRTPSLVLKLSALLSRVPNVLSVIGAALLAWGLYSVKQGPQFPGYQALYPVVGTALLIFSGPNNALSRQVLSLRPLVLVGLISYPLYLLHWPLLSIGHTTMVASQDGEELSLALRLGLVAISVAGSAAIYKVIEQPIRNGRRSRAKTVLLCGIMGMIALASWATCREKGLPWRLAPEAQAFYSFNEGGNQWDAGKCFFESEKDAMKIDIDGCTSNRDKAGLPQVYLWGDSHAAHLSKALSTAVNDSARVTHLSLGRCPPVLDGNAMPECLKRNQVIFEDIKRSQPQSVVLAGFWGHWNYQPVAKTISELKNAGIKKIILVGPTVRWKKWPRYVIADAIQADPLRRVRRRYQRAVVPVEESQTEALREIAAQQQVTYVAPYDLFCDRDGCLALTGDAPDTMIGSDHAHLTVFGAQQIVSALGPFWKQ